MKIEGVISTQHENAACVAAAIKTDNMSDIKTVNQDGRVVTTLIGTSFSRVIATVDDYLMSLTVADEVSTSKKDETDQKESNACNFIFE
ncbi:MAG: hypothetical protein LBV40_02115 [Methanomicrobiales archaeon]|jgi:hypothetical protein|nr:hypothetical protein [Methanomicrobiales archaeon]